VYLPISAMLASINSVIAVTASIVSTRLRSVHPPNLPGKNMGEGGQVSPCGGVRGDPTPLPTHPVPCVAVTLSNSNCVALGVCVVHVNQTEVIKRRNNNMICVYQSRDVRVCASVARGARAGVSPRRILLQRAALCPKWQGRRLSRSSNEPPRLMGIMWSTLNAIGCLGGSVRSIDIPHIAHGSP
jgi:hypothetical protein